MPDNDMTKLQRFFLVLIPWILPAMVGAALAVIGVII